MSPIYTYLCDYCGHEFDELKMSRDPDEVAMSECRCESMAKRIPSAFGGYTGDTGSASTRPKNAASKGGGKPLNFKKDEK